MITSLSYLCLFFLPLNREGEGRREFTSLSGNRQLKIVIERIRNKINLSKVKAVLLTVQFTQK